MEKMTLGRQCKDGRWTGAIGEWLGSNSRRALSDQNGREEGRCSLPGENTNQVRTRVLGVASEYVKAMGLEFVHEITSDQWLEIKINLVDDIRSNLPAGKAEPNLSTLRTYVGTIRTFVRFCTKRRWIPQVRCNEIVDALNLPAIEEQRKFLIIPGYRWPAIFEAAKTRHPLDRVICVVAFYTLMRVSELSRFTWGDILWDDKKIAFHRDKNNGARLTVEMGDILYKTLWDWRETLKGMFGVEEIPGDWHVIPSRPKCVGGQKMHPEWPVLPTASATDVLIVGALKHACMAVGFTAGELEGQGIHLTRRSGAEDLYQLGWDIRLISEMLGHGKPGEPNTDQTMRYLGHAIDDEMKRAAANRESSASFKGRRDGRRVGTTGAGTEVEVRGAPVDEVQPKLAKWISDGKLTPAEGLKLLALLMEG